jgi:hypothetical protein
MSPITKKSKKESSEKELEGFLFGGSTEDLWSKTGQELDQKIENANSEEEEEEEEGAEEVILYTLYFSLQKITH